MKRHWKRWLVGGIALVVVFAVGGPYLFIHVIEGPPKAKLALPAVSASAPRTTSTTSTTSSPGSSNAPGTGDPSVAGLWKVASGSQAGYRVEEVLVGQSTTAVGRTSEVSGQLRIAGTTVSAASFTVQMASVVSNESQRNAQFDGRIMDVAAYPTARFTLSKPVELGTIPPVGKTVHVAATGDLTMHGVARTLTIELSAERIGPDIDVLGDADILFSDWHIQNPSVAGFVTTADHGTLEVLLHLVPA
jgi:polyisoprenoid-binding protein YceI